MGTKRVGWARIRSLINENQNQLKMFKQQVIHFNNKATTLTSGQSGATVFWTHGSTHNIKLPAATPGMSFKFIIMVGSAHTQNIAAAAGEGFIGKAVVTKTGADDKNSTQNEAVIRDYIKLHLNTASLGGDTGDVIDIVCLNAGEWLVDARLTSSANPSATDVIAD